jgi:2-iminobutanoate/2-iminopropanoate deaminase
LLRTAVYGRYEKTFQLRRRKSMAREIVKTDGAPAALGPYSQAVKADGWIFCSGQIAMNPQTGELEEGIQAQTERCLKNLSAVLEAAGATLADAVKATVFIKDMNQFGQMNEVYGKFFSESPPARACVEVARLPKDVLVEIELIARVP